MSDTEENGLSDIFNEPEGYYEPEKQPSFVSYEILGGQQLSLRLIGHSPLWGHLLWNAGKTLSTYLESNSSTLIKNKTILELGAGAGLPSLVCALHGAARVIVTDYPDADLVENLHYNVNYLQEQFPSKSDISKILSAEGFLWGAPVSTLLDQLPRLSSGERGDGFDLLILGDVIFNHSEHVKLLSSVTSTLARTPDAQALVFFTPYRSWLIEKDLHFFTLAREAGLEVEALFEKIMPEFMFEDDPRDDTLRRTLFAYSMRWKEDHLKNRGSA